jgi:hypothetical protein
MSALPLIADEQRIFREVGFVPIAEVSCSWGCMRPVDVNSVGSRLWTKDDTAANVT